MHPPEKEIPPRVFVAVPSYNHAPFVERCLRSIISQTLPPAKVLVIDDGSTDGSPSIIEKVLADCPFDCELIARGNRGLCATLNEAFALSTGEYFAYLGSDDIWLPTLLAEQTRLLNSRPEAVLAFAHAYLIDEDDNVIGTTKEWTDFADGDMLPLLLSGTIFSSPAVLYRRSALEKHAWNEAARLEDYEMYLRLAGEGDFARNPKILAAWRQHGVNASTNLPAMFPEMIAAQDRVAPQLGISRDDLERSQRTMKFEAAENFVRHGFRREAARLFIENIRGAASLSQILGTAFRLAVPQSLFQWNRRRKRRNAAVRFGKLDEMINKTLE